jgi:eukaryotic-like serine/threonine-protein kinase
MSAVPSSVRPSRRRIGRFELKSELGRGAQATVWLAYDARLDREVAVKLLHPGADALAVSQWLHEARSVSRLNHPHIVPVYEADEQQGQSYLVFEYVPGPTLAEKLRRDGALAPREAVMLMLGVVDALTAAHAAGIVHRDLKPSNILVDGAGRARVMDFGIAARVKDGSDQRIVGTPGYMSPEAARGEAPAPSMDLFAAGMMLGELLAGRPLLRERDPYRAIERIQHEDMTLPPEMGPQVDDGLRAIVLRAVARDPAQRVASAVDLRAALTQWLTPAETANGAAPSGNATLDFLLRRMRHKSDFPALSNSVARIQRVANSDSESLNSLSEEILKDVALTNKLLRLVNTAHFSTAGGAVSTVSRAIALVGFAGIRNMALSLVLLEHMQDKHHAQQLKEEFLRSLMAGALASELCGQQRDAEEAFIGSMFHGLGRMLTEFYFPEEARQVRDLVRPVGNLPAIDEHAASTRVLGMSFEDLGLGVARHWGLPETLQKCMRRPEGEPGGKPAERGPERLRWLAAATNEVADALLYCDPKEAAKRIESIGQRFARTLSLEPEDFATATELARTKLSQMTAAMNLRVAPQSPAQRLLHNPADAATVVFRPDDSLTPHQLQATAPMPLDGDAAVQPGRAADMLAAGIQDITNTMVSDNFRLNEVLRMILETMLRGLRFRRVVFCLRDAKIDALTGRFGLGEGADTVVKAFKVPLRLQRGSTPDLFMAVCSKGADTLIADAYAPNIAQRLPAWYREGINAPAFLVLPLMMKNSTFALIYADMAHAGGFKLDEKELSLLRTLRNQAVMAFRQASS